MRDPTKLAFPACLELAMCAVLVLGSMGVSGNLPTFPSPNLTLTLTPFFGQNVRFGEG